MEMETETEMAKVKGTRGMREVKVTPRKRAEWSQETEEHP
jgi:hypothetical protein